jgi:hypothetical protein
VQATHTLAPRLLTAGGLLLAGLSLAFSAAFMSAAKKMAAGQ